MGLRELGVAGAADTAGPTEMPGWGPRSEVGGEGCLEGPGAGVLGRLSRWQVGRGMQDGEGGPGVVGSPGVLGGSEVVRRHFRAASLAGHELEGWEWRPGREARHTRDADAHSPSRASCGYVRGCGSPRKHLACGGTSWSWCHRGNPRNTGGTAAPTHAPRDAARRPTVAAPPRFP